MLFPALKFRSSKTEDLQNPQWKTMENPRYGNLKKNLRSSSKNAAQNGRLNSNSSNGKPFKAPDVDAKTKGLKALV